MIEPLPPELAKLIAAERAAPVAGHAIRAVVRAKVAATVAGAPLGAAAGAGALGVGKILAIIAVVVGAGTVAVINTRTESAQSRPRVVQAVSHVGPAAKPEPAPAPPIVTEVPTTRDVPRSAPPPPPKPSIPSQAELLQQAWSLLSGGEAQHALDLAVKDAQVHADGALSEEREALRIVALAKLGRAAEAADASSAFLAKYPTSIHREVIARAISGASQ
jgi:hypothetical protein